MTILSLEWESLYLQDGIFILNNDPPPQLFLIMQMIIHLGLVMYMYICIGELIDYCFK